MEIVRIRREVLVKEVLENFQRYTIMKATIEIPEPAIAARVPVKAREETSIANAPIGSSDALHLKPPSLTWL